MLDSFSKPLSRTLAIALFNINKGTINLDGKNFVRCSNFIGLCFNSY